MQERYAASVIGPSAIFPRGYLWLPPVWGCAAIAALAVLHWPPPWFRLPVAAGLLVALITFVAVLGSLRSNAFLADHDGVWLGARKGARRRWRRGRLRYLPWAEIARLQLRKAPYGCTVKVILRPAAPPAGRPARAIRLAGRWLLLLLIPPAYLFCRAALVSPAGDPPRYRVRLRAAAVADLGVALRALAPSDVAVTVLTRRRQASADLPEAVPAMAASESYMAAS